MAGLTRHAELPDEVERVVHSVISCAIEVHRHLGPGLLESLYEHALVHELERAGLSASRQVEIRVPYKDVLLPPYRVDLIVGERVIVEIKAVDTLAPVHAAQLLSYLRMTGLPVGLLLNFNQDVLKGNIKRIVNERSADFTSSRPSRLRVQP
jgi:GxxExxY protein